MKDWYLKLTEEFEAEIWKDCIFVFDTSSLLDLYLYSDTTQKDIFSNIFQILKKRLWITQNIKYEFLKHRETKIYLPVVKYNELVKKSSNNKDKGYLERIEQGIKEITSLVKSFESETQKNDKHPFFPENFNDELKQSLNNFNNVFINFKNKTVEQIEHLRKSIEESVKLKQDNVAGAIDMYFSVGNDFAYNQVMEIVKEGAFRYKHKLPPGYEDESNKIGIAVYGDLIIWKQIIDIAKNLNKDVILITNDTKIDWCYRKDKEHDKIERPREELISEIQSEASVRFWMYTTTQFLYKSKFLLKAQIQEETLIEVSEVKVSNEEAILLNVAKWIENNYPIESIEFNKQIGNPISSIDIYAILKNGDRLAFEFRGLKTNEHVIRFRIGKGYQLISNRLIDKFILLLAIPEMDIRFDLNELILKYSNTYTSCQVIGIYKENNQFYSIN